MKTAIIDIGTNTFNLLIVEKTGPDSIQILENKKSSVKLGKGGINQKKIGIEASRRGIIAIQQFFEIINTFGISDIRAYATEGVRMAKNNLEFIARLKNDFNLSIQVITGDKEAELIFAGVKHTLQLTKQPALIVDIGGGSTEFIIGNENGLLWKKSYPLGVTRLYESFNPSDPITYSELEEIASHIKNTLQPLKRELEKYQIDTLIGASGAFENLPAMIDHSLPSVESETSKVPVSIKISKTKLEELLQELIGSTLKERLKMKGLEKFRADVMVMAAILLDVLLENSYISQIFASPFAMKEGVAYNLIEH